jgi:hypothetical protein
MSGDDDVDYEAVRRRAEGRQSRLVPLAFDIFYPLLVAVILIAAARWYGIINERDLGLRMPRAVQELLWDLGIR